MPSSPERVSRQFLYTRWVCTNQCTPCSIFRLDRIKIRIAPSWIFVDTTMHGDLPMQVRSNLCSQALGRKHGHIVCW